ncbi:hypothetical protein HD597_005372 [Nonomuraea thailandensis]|uniref:Uncharacterized protein n=1 Tax=Nonomuraea thailandensis TaxID=1188745 RepID=A0A9X2GGV6_9ACTN|nr:hypothetical protein [Nonomuraea thailandensis]MCP2358352.1 hypothetical protein [Nonomuraea thailandensis]
MLLNLAVAVVLALVAGGPTWLSAGLGLAYAVAKLVGLLAGARLLQPRADAPAGTVPRACRWAP